MLIEDGMSILRACWALTHEEDSDVDISEDEEEENQITDECIKAEVFVALGHIRNNKVAGTDEIPVDSTPSGSWYGFAT